MSQSSSLNREKILAALAHVPSGQGEQDVVAADLISGVTIMQGNVGFLLQGNASHEPLRQACEAAVRALPGVDRVTVVLTAHDQPTPTAPQKAATWDHTPIAGVQRIIAVASGKGGVGKSTVTALLALAMAKQGKSVGILDADIYGPSIPTMFGLADRAEMQDGKLIPGQAHGIKAMSMGLIIGDQAAVMRAPRVTKALQQMLRQTHWAPAEAPLDTLLVDMPPGTGDVHISMVQQAPITGAIIVTLASKVAVLDARKSIEMFEKTNVPILGIIENMSHIPGGPAPFGSGGGELLANETGYPLLAKLPLEAEIGELLNDGKNPFDRVANSELLAMLEAMLPLA